jgi:hypothetical protein
LPLSLLLVRSIDVVGLAQLGGADDLRGDVVAQPRIVFSGSRRFKWLIKLASPRRDPFANQPMDPAD